MDERTGEAMRPEYGAGVRVFGQRLRRLMLRHVFVLEWLGNGLMVRRPGEEVSPGEVLLAARVCGAQREEELERVLALAESRVGRWRIGWQGFRSRRGFWRGYAQMKGWMNREMGCLPQVLPGPKAGRYQAEWTVMLMAKVMRERGCESREAWWTPLGEAMHLRLAWEEQDGKEFRVVTDEFREEMREMGHEL